MDYEEARDGCDGSAKEREGALLAGLIAAVDDFLSAWFPDAADPDAVQTFWFAARYARERKFFRKLCRRFGPPLLVARRLAAHAPHRLLDDLEGQSLDCRARFRLCIFVDQQSRNMRALAHEAAPVGGKSAAPSTEEGVIECTRLALALAARVLGTLPDAASLLEGGDSTPAQVCFFTLALRHSRGLEDSRRAGRILDELDRLRPGLAVVAAFQRENLKALQRLEDAEYVRLALIQDTPERWAAAGELAGPAPEGADACLAPMCFHDGSTDRLLDWVDDECSWTLLSAHPLCVELASALRAHGLLQFRSRVVLSFSGGVDSTAHLLLLLAAVRYCIAGHGCNRPTCVDSCEAPDAVADQEVCTRVCCLQLLYPNRDAAEVESEREWAIWTCRRLGVDLYGYVMKVARPHTDSDHSHGLSREEYERHTKEIRFRMYRCLMNGETFDTAAVVLGHHLDDVDENRLDHLQKGHTLGDVEGMRPWREVLDVPLSRPLLRRRKVDFLNLLAEFPTPYLRDSTPAWSVRGATRRVLDGLCSKVRGPLLVNLDCFGRLAAEVGAELGDAITGWVAAHVTTLELPRGPTVVVLSLDELLRLSVGRRLAEVIVVVEEIREVWNSAVRSMTNELSSPVSEIPGSNADDVPFLLFERGFFAAAQDLLMRRHGHYHTSDGFSVNRRAVRHLYENIRDCQKPDFGGGLTQELGYVHVMGPPRTLVLYDASAYPGMDFKAMRGTIVATVRRL